MGRVSKYSEEFRRQVAMLVVDGGRACGMSRVSLASTTRRCGTWVGALKRERAAPGGLVSGDE